VRLTKRYPTAYKYYQEIIGELYYEILLAGFFCRKLSIRRLRRHESKNENCINTLFSFKNGIPPYSLSFFQTKQEIAALFSIVQKAEPRIICEIGTDMGGTLYIWTKVLQNHGKLISIDLPRLYRKSINRFFKKFILPSQEIHFIRENSHSHKSIKQLKSILSGQVIDFLFIDGDHSYDGVKSDFFDYLPFVRPQGGIIALHDISIIDKPDNICGVSTFWNEIKSQYKYEEIVQPDGCGIGLVFLG
jgi:predicted O-methyltransferase YrrM